MKKLACSFVFFAGILSTAFIANAATVSGGVWYDHEELAVAIDMNHPEWKIFNRLELDFNADREWGQIVDGSEWLNIDNQRVRRFEFGVYRRFEFPDGRNVRYFGWSYNPLMENENVSNWAVAINNLYYGEKSPESLYCYTNEWAPANEAMTVYCQELDAAGNRVPVLPENLGNVFVRYEDTDWTPMSALQALEPPVEVGLQVLPNVLNRNSKGQFVTVKVNLPDDISASDISFDMSLQFVVPTAINSNPAEAHVQPVKWNGLMSRDKKDSSLLIFKVPREKITEELPPGEAKIHFSGKMLSGSKIIAEGTVLIR